MYTLTMALTMTVPMVASMRYRGHAWRPNIEMAASMLIPTFAVMCVVNVMREGLAWQRRVALSSGVRAEVDRQGLAPPRPHAQTLSLLTVFRCHAGPCPRQSAS
jgi:hypothetical protein